MIRRRLVLPLLWVLTTTSSVQGNEKLGPGVKETIQNGGKANVVVLLTIPQKLSDGPELFVKSIADIQQATITRTSGIRSSKLFTNIPALAVVIDQEQALTDLMNNSNVARIDLDVGGVGTLASSVPLLHADERVATGNDGSGVVVAILDSGLDLDHPSFAGRVVAQACFLDRDGSIDGVGGCPNGSDRQVGVGSAEDDESHGTHVTGIVASPMGVAPGTEIVALKVLDSNNRFHLTSEIVAALDYIINENSSLKIKVINMSISTNTKFTGTCDYSSSWAASLSIAVNRLRGMGVTLFASAGNDSSTTTMGAPACVTGVISVGASTLSDEAASFTTNPDFTDIFAPGESIVSTGLGSTTTTKSGTSMACAHAVGCAALFIQSGEATTPDEVESKLKESAVTIVRGGNSFPRIDCGIEPFDPCSDDCRFLFFLLGTRMRTSLPLIGCHDMCVADFLVFIWQFFGHRCGSC